MEDDDPLDELARWLASQRETIGQQVHLKRVDRAHGERTEVAIDHRLRFGPRAWRVSTNAAYLRERQFSSMGRHYIRTANRSRGRAIYCHDLVSEEVVAALSYHIPEPRRMPVVITMIAFRTDLLELELLRARTVRATLVAKHYVHAIAETIGRGGHVDIDLADRSHESVLRELGFRQAPAVRGFRAGGKHLRQPAPVG